MVNSNIQVIVQAGGRGSRLRHHTWNKPKCLVSIEGKPLLYHLFKCFESAKFWVIGDYLFNQLQTYVEVNPPPVNVRLLKTINKGTCAGIADALSLVDQHLPVLLVWSDLLFRSTPIFSSTTRPIVILTDSFVCRWSANDQNELIEHPSSKRGVPGAFYFPKASMFPKPPPEGEFVKWFSTNVQNFDIFNFSSIDEVGDFTLVEESNRRSGFSRFFNRVDVRENEVIKSVIAEEYQVVHDNEVAWYQEAEKLNFKRIPKIHSLKPLRMSRIRGDHPYQMHDLSPREKRSVLADILDSLAGLHDKGQRESSKSDIRYVYLTKTRERVNAVSKLIPGFNRTSITINGRKCRNIFSKSFDGLLEAVADKLIPSFFTPIHGDPTFSNTLIDHNLRAWFIDPRGYFAQPGIYGDPMYDYAKVYYSAVGGFDSFNRRQFKLHIDEDTVEILKDPTDFENLARELFTKLFPDDIEKIETIHALIWLSLTGYAIDDIDSVIGSFYTGLFWLENALQSTEA